MMGVGIHPRTGEPWLEATNEAVGFGAHAGGDGEDGIMHLTEPGCRNNPVEVLETKAPMLIESYGLRRDSGGPGKHRGGLGVRGPTASSAPRRRITLVKKTRTKPWGLAGGKEGDPCHVILRPGTDRERRVGSVYEAMEAGEVLVNCAGGGGGWGDPFERRPRRVSSRTCATATYRRAGRAGLRRRRRCRDDDGRRLCDEGAPSGAASRVTDRGQRVQEATRGGARSLLLVAPPKMAYVCGFRPSPYERLVALVVPVEGPLRLVVPSLEEEAARTAVTRRHGSFMSWRDEDGPGGAVSPPPSPAPAAGSGIEKSHLTVGYHELAGLRHVPGASFADCGGAARRPAPGSRTSERSSPCSGGRARSSTAWSRAWPRRSCPGATSRGSATSPNG